jgi:iron-sulfur cluster assembly protein
MLKPISITHRAVQEIKHIMTNKNIPEGYGLRVLVQGGGGCGGAKFRLGFDKLKEGDMQYMVDDIPIYYEKKQVMYLMGLEIDFEERTDARGFVFNTSPINVI